MKKDQAMEDKANNKDRLKGTFIDGYYKNSDIRNIADEFFKKGEATGLRDRAMFLLSFACLYRGQSVRELQLADMYTIEMDDGSELSQTVALCNVLRNGN
jgi:hypothetical protein